MGNRATRQTQGGPIMEAVSARFQASIGEAQAVTNWSMIAFKVALGRSAAAALAGSGW